ncbi:MAG: acyl-CoA dehydrogenase family protein [Pseudomonadota bacterium]
MLLNLSAEDQAFQDEVRSFMTESAPAALRQKVERNQTLTREDFLSWHRILYARGWIAPAWPVEFGGPGWSPMQRHIFQEELALASMPMIMPFGINMVGPVIMRFGNDTQRAKYLPRILSGEDWWCQGYSEPGSGSDLASLKTRAERDGDVYVVNGAKTWTTHANFADMMFCLVRTSNEGKRQNGITFLLIDMKSEGVTVKPIRTMDGGVEINEVFLDEVRVPVENLIGEEGRGWTYAKFLLGNERTGMARIGRSRKHLDRIRSIAAQEPLGDGTLLDDQKFQEKIAAIEIDILALESLVLQVLAEESAGTVPGPEASFLKIRGTEIEQAITELTMEAVGNYAMPYQPEVLEQGWNEEPVGPDYAVGAAPLYFNFRKASIYGGTNEIQKNIVARMILGV